MNISEYLSNPMGKGASVLMLSSIRRELDAQYEQLNSRMSVKWYSLKKHIYIAHIKIPSRKHERLFYDVVLQFNIEDIEEVSKVINPAEVKVFSNCPSFTYTYAYVFNDKKNLIEWTRKKYNKQILSKSPETRNPNQVLNYERSLYLAFKYITSKDRNYIMHIKTVAISIKTPNYLLSSIKSNDEIENSYKEYDQTFQKKKDMIKPSKPVATDKKHSETEVPKKGAIATTQKTKKVTKTKTTKKIKSI